MPSFTPLAKRFLKPKQLALPGMELSREIARKKKRESKKKGRLAILCLFFLTVFASLFFYLKAEWPQFWEKISTPFVISTFPEEAEFDPSPVLGTIEGLTQDLRGSYGVYVYRLASGESYGFQAEKIFTAASLIKLPVMLAVFQEAEKGSLRLADYQAKLEAMGQRSDNAAFNQLVQEFGEAKMQAVIDNLGMAKTSFKNNETTPQDVGLFFRELYQGRLVSQEHQKEFFRHLTDTIYEDRIPAGIPEEITVVHKIGTELGSFSDAGLIISEQPFVLVIMSDGARESEAKEVLPQITQAVWEFENRTH